MAVQLPISKVWDIEVKKQEKIKNEQINCFCKVWIIPSIVELVNSAIFFVYIYFLCENVEYCIKKRVKPSWTGEMVLINSGDDDVRPLKNSPAIDNKTDDMESICSLKLAFMCQVHIL